MKHIYIHDHETKKYTYIHTYTHTYIPEVRSQHPHHEWEPENMADFVNNDVKRLNAAACMYVCMYVYTCIYICVCIYMCVYMYIYIDGWMAYNMYTCESSICIHAYHHMYTCISYTVWKKVNMICTTDSMNTYIHLMYTYMYTYMYTLHIYI